MQIKEIGDRLSAANNLPKQKYYLVRTAEPNAFVLQGHVFVTTSMLSVLKNKDGAAIVLGHEMGHVLAGKSAAIVHQILAKYNDINADHMAERLGLLAIVGGVFLFLKLFGGFLGSDFSYFVRLHISIM